MQSDFTLKEYEISIDENYLSNIRIDKFLSDNLEELSRSKIVKLLGDKMVTVNEKVISKNYKVMLGDVIKLRIPVSIESEILPQDIPLDIIYEDNSLLIVNKSKDIVVHPANGNYDGTLVNALMYHCKDSLSGIGGVIRPGIVHRIDKDTSGLLIVAKNDEAHIKISNQIKDHTVKRVYHAIVYGRLKDEEGCINLPIGRHPRDRKKMGIVYTKSKPAVTHYRVLERFDKFTHVELRLETGRTHQIRVHMAHIGHPVAGDPVYGPKKIIHSLKGQCLHAKLIGFSHPNTNQYMEFESDLPEYFKQFIKSCSNNNILDN
jgi:23S rRNA pseudouridine1911/1915/1917 synthase